MFKKLLIGGAVLLLIFIIYLSTMDKKVYYLVLGDSLATSEGADGLKVRGYTDIIADNLRKMGVLEAYIKGFASDGMRIPDLINDIECNKEINVDGDKITLKNALVKADLVTLSIGANDLLNKINSEYISDEDVYDYIDEMTDDLDKLIKLIREYSKEDIIMTGYYNPFKNVDGKKFIDYLNKRYKEVSKNYDVIYVGIGDLFVKHPEYLPNDNNIHPSQDGYEAIAEEVMKKVNKNLFEAWHFK